MKEHLVTASLQRPCWCLPKVQALPCALHARFERECAECYYTVIHRADDRTGIEV